MCIRDRDRVEASTCKVTLQPRTILIVRSEERRGIALITDIGKKPNTRPYGQEHQQGQTGDNRHEHRGSDIAHAARRYDISHGRVSSENHISKLGI